MADNATSQSSRDAKREALRKKREAELKRQRRNRITLISVITIVALILALGIGYLLLQSLKPEEELPLNQPQSISEEAPFLTVGNAAEGTPKVDLVLDFMCPFCGQFEAINGSDVNEIIASGEANINFYLRTFLSERASTTSYSARAAGAAVCTYEESPELFLTYMQSLFTNQPQEGGPGLPDSQLVSLAAEAGASQETQDCITNHTYQRFATDVLEPAGAALDPATPAIYINDVKLDQEVVNGQQMNWTVPGYFRSKVQEAAAAN